MFQKFGSLILSWLSEFSLTKRCFENVQEPLIIEYLAILELL